MMVLWILIALMTMVAVFIVLLPLMRFHYLRTAVVVLLALPVAGVFLYLHYGSSQKFENYFVLEQRAKEVKAELARIKDPQQIIDKLIAHLQASPNSPRGWYLLGRLYLGRGQYAKAASALSRAYHLKPTNIDYITSYAQASFFRDNRKLTPKMRGLLEDVLKRMPYNVPAINLLAIDAYVGKRYRVAVNYWESLIPVFTPGSKDSQLILSMISRAQKKLAGKPMASEKFELNTQVILSPTMQKQAGPADLVFIYAIQSEGAPVPLAVMRRQVRELPLKLDLARARSMLPGRGLRIGQSIKLIARVARSGSALPEVGDLQSKPVRLTLHKGKNSATLTINYVLK